MSYPAPPLFSNSATATHLALARSFASNFDAYPLFDHTPPCIYIWMGGHLKNGTDGLLGKIWSLENPPKNNMKTQSFFKKNEMKKCKLCIVLLSLDFTTFQFINEVEMFFAKKNNGKN
jgi:hypothetical protein